MEIDVNTYTVEELERLLTDYLRPDTFKYESYYDAVDVILVKDGHGPFGTLGSGDSIREALTNVLLMTPRSWRTK